MALLRRTSLVWQASWTSTLTFETLPVLKEWTIQSIFEQPVRICQTTLSVMVFLSKSFASGAVKIQRNNKILACYHSSRASFKGSNKTIRQALRLMENIVMAQIEWVAIWMHSTHLYFFIPLLENALGHNDSFLFAHGLKECKSCDLSWLWC